ncbi:MAG TPA: patatin-like phospholipase family protein [Bellilinea sp.]
MDEIVLALGGGGLKGIAHLGVVFRLMEAGYRIKAIAGTSAGSVVGAVIASGAKKEEIINVLSTLNTQNFFSRRDHDGPSLLGLSGLVKLLSPFLEGKMFSDLKIPLAVTAVDILSKQEYILNRGSVIEAVVASSSIPGVFPPVRIGKTELVDGGILDPVPVSVVRWMKPKLPIVAVCLSPEPEKWPEMPEVSVPLDTHIPKLILNRIIHMRISQAIRIFVDSMDITSRMITELRLELEKPDVIIRPDVMKFGYLDPTNPQELLKIGADAMEKALPELEHSLTWRHKFGRQFQNPQPPSRVLEE